MNTNKNTNKVSFSAGLKFLMWVFVFVLLGLATVSNHSDDQYLETVPAPQSIPLDEQVVSEASEGKTCTDEPVLTDTIVVQDATGKTSIMGFDPAYAAAEAGEITVHLYCK